MTDLLTPEEYLLGENDKAHGVRCEYANGFVYAIPESSRNHGLVKVALGTCLLSHLTGTGCEVFMTDLKVRIQTNQENYFYYPDIQVSCAEETEKYFNTSPCLIVEVLSDSTARTDRTEKFFTYTRLPSLQEYVLCSQDSPAVEIYRRRSDWKAEYYRAGDQLVLESVDMTLLVDEVYGFLLRE